MSLILIVINGIFRYDELLHGLEYAAITEMVERSSILHLKRWTRSSSTEANQANISSSIAL